MNTWQVLRAEFDHHVHQHAYATLVLSGAYEEAGDSGRHFVSAGDVILHDAFEAHLDRIAPTGAKVLNLPVPSDACFRAGMGTVEDPDVVVALAENNRVRASEFLLSIVKMHDMVPGDWPDALAAALLHHGSIHLSTWADEHDIARWKVSRGFTQVFGVSPCVFRARARARRAWHAICTTQAPLAAIAAELGFSDQPHMTRSVTALTGRSPLAWRPDCK